MNDTNTYDLATPRRTRRLKIADASPCCLIDCDSGDFVSRHASIAEAALEARRIAAYRSARKLEVQALVIIPVGGAR
jgi:hypothetical protein